MTCDSLSRLVIKQIIADRKFTTIEPDSESLPALQMVHSKAMTLYRRGDLGRAVKRLDGFFDHHDYRRIDPTGTDSSYTMILEDFAFFLLKSKGDFSWTRELLAYVLTRDPERATAHLNLGDLLYRDASTRKEGRESYRRYLELMTERGLQRKVPKKSV